MDSRRRILDALRAASPPAAPAPDLSAAGVRFDDPVAKLADAIGAVAGTLVRVPGDPPSPPRSGGERLSASAENPPSPPRSGAEGLSASAENPPSPPRSGAEGLSASAENPPSPPRSGGEGWGEGAVAALREAIAALAANLGVSSIASAVPAVPGTVDLAAVEDGHALEGLGLAVLPGAFAVAENGAVWVAGDVLRPRAVFVVAEHLALVVAAADVVNDMHEAYRRIAFPDAGFGTFIAGPSKTADIEQALVIGAHGARSCTVFLVG